MANRSDCRLETACRCLDVTKPKRKDWLSKTKKEYERTASLLEALSDPVRLRVLDMLSNGSLYVCLIQHLLDDIKYSKLSYHLDVLKRQGLIASDRQGNFLLYHLTPHGKRIAEMALNTLSK